MPGRPPPGGEDEVLGGVAQVVAQGETRLDPGQWGAWSEAPGLCQVVAGSQGGVGDPQPQVGVRLGELGHGEAADLVEGHEVVVAGGAKGPALVGVPGRVGQDGTEAWAAVGGGRAGVVLPLVVLGVVSCVVHGGSPCLPSLCSSWRGG